MKLSVYTVCSLCAAAVSGRNVLQHRQASTTSVAPAASTTAAQDNGAISSSARSSALGLPTLSTSANSSILSSLATPHTTAPPSSISLVPGSSPTLITSTTPGNDTTSGDPIPLPLPPTLTPAVGLTGAVLLITGLAYGIIGIRSKYLYTFFGVAYPIALAVLILILYCMNPPVSNSIQGAYFVAIVITGSLCGGVALVFRDLADGFGCLLGGFCIAMWLLTLKDGGTISNTVGKACFIGIFTVVVGATGLSHRTRKWGLTGSIPFSGATATVLGIDCFSRAGLKEFWLYIWNINSNMFPLGTTTYPLTRGMKVEIAGIILLFLLGVVSQVKLSKVLKDRRKAFKEKRARRQSAATREARPMGARITSMLRDDPGGYEVMHGSKSGSTLMTSPRSESADEKSFTVLERSVALPEVEMANIRPMSHRSISTNKEDRMHGQQYGKNKKWNGGQIGPSASRDSVIEVEQRQAGGLDKQGSKSATDLSLASSAPEVMPLPFKIPGIEVHDAGSRGSLSVIEQDFLNKRNSSQRLSGASWKPGSSRNSVGGVMSARESVMIIEDDGASSVAATFDELDEDQMSLSAVTLPRSPMDDTFSLVSLQNSNRASIHQALPLSGLDLTHTSSEATMSREQSQSGALLPTAATVPDSDRLSKRHSAANSTLDDQPGESRDALAPANPTSNRSSSHSDARKSATSNNSVDAAGRLKIVVPQEPSQPLTENILSEKVGDGVSRITLQYRTNEWAKHLDGAQVPEDDSMSSPPSPGVQVDAVLPGAQAHKFVSPIVDSIPLKPVPERSSTDPLAHRRKQSRNEALAALTGPSSKPQSQVGKSSNRHSTKRPSSQNDGIIRVRTSSGTAVAWSGPSQRQSVNALSEMLRASIVESPADDRTDDLRRGLQKRTSSTQGPKPELKRTKSDQAFKSQSTRSAQQDIRPKSQPKSQPFAASAPNLVITPETPAASILHGQSSPMPLQRINEHEIPAQRTPGRPRSPQIREQLKPPSRQASFAPSSVIGHDLQNFDSHQPSRRTSAILSASQHRRENLLTNWRESLREDQNSKKPATQQRPDADEAQRARLLQEKRQRQAKREQEKKEKAKMDEKITNKMQSSSDMVEAHRRAMLKMQNNVKHP